MYFRVVSYPEDLNVRGIRTCILVRDNWDDYRYKTLFQLIYLDSLGARHEIGNIKIMQAGMPYGLTPIDTEFMALSDAYASLGQSQDFYEGLVQIEEPDRTEILIALRDVVWSEAIQQQFAHDDAFQTSLLRTIGDAQIKKFRNILHHRFENTPYHFTYRFPQSDVGMEFVVTPDSLPPTNVHVVIGRNGIGKTTLLRNLTTLLESPESGENRGAFSFEHDLSASTDVKEFANVVTVAFSAFDDFPAPRNDAGGIRYSYVGLRDFSATPGVRKLKTASELEDEFATSTLLCLRSTRRNRWSSTIRILQCDGIFANLGILQLLDYEDDRREGAARSIFQSASSGHKIVLLALTRLVELVDERTLVLIDEPEAHLHPPLQGAYIRALSALLIERNGVAILATHSPVMLQEVPSDCVWLMFREAETSISRPTLETFAENLSVLTQEVFRYELTESGFYTLLRSAALKSDSPEEAVAEFHGHLGSEGRSITRALWRNIHNA